MCGDDFLTSSLEEDLKMTKGCEYLGVFAFLMSVANLIHCLAAMSNERLIYTMLDRNGIIGRSHIVLALFATLSTHQLFGLMLMRLLAYYMFDILSL